MTESRKDQIFFDSRLVEEVGWDDELLVATYRRFDQDGVTVVEERPATDDDLRRISGVGGPFWGQGEGQ